MEMIVHVVNVIILFLFPLGDQRRLKSVLRTHHVTYCVMVFYWVPRIIDKLQKTAVLILIYFFLL